PTCFGTKSSPYALQYYDQASSFSTASLITLTAGQSATAIDASLMPGASISGSVDAGGIAIAGVCVFASATDGTFGQAATDGSGDYTISGLPPDSYTVEFDPTCGGSQSSSYAIQYYNGASS